jgi:phosphate transport system substrate-binding protein
MASSMREDLLDQVRKPAAGRRVAIAAVGLAVALIAAGCGKSGGGPVTAGNSGGGARSLSGAGATFPQPIYEKWFSDFGQSDLGKGVQVNYQGIGSGGGIKQFTAKTVDFGATDVAMTDEELKTAEQAGGTVIHLPMVLGAVAVTYNLPSATKPLQLDGKLIGDIYLGKVKNWNDPEIAAQNPGVTLPDLAIATVHRSDGSGTNANFTNFVADYNPEFKAKIGTGKEGNWVGGIGGKGNDGVAAAVKQTKGAIGYNELNYALKNNLKYANVKNASGKYVQPTIGTTSASATSADLAGVPDDFRTFLVDSKNPAAYPISAWTFVIVFQKQADAAKGKTLVNLLWYMSHGAQSSARDLDYSPLPTDVIPKIEAKIKSITGPDGAALYTGQ